MACTPSISALRFAPALVAAGLLFAGCTQAGATPTPVASPAMIESASPGAMMESPSPGAMMESATPDAMMEQSPSPAAP